MLFLPDNGLVTGCIMVMCFLFLPDLCRGQTQNSGQKLNGSEISYSIFLLLRSAGVQKTLQEVDAGLFPDNNFVVDMAGILNWLRQNGVNVRLEKYRHQKCTSLPAPAVFLISWPNNRGDSKLTTSKYFLGCENEKLHFATGFDELRKTDEIAYFVNESDFLLQKDMEMHLIFVESRFSATKWTVVLGILMACGFVLVVRKLRGAK